jgi:hypothetical protein
VVLSLENIVRKTTKRKEKEGDEQERKDETRRRRLLGFRTRNEADAGAICPLTQLTADEAPEFA